MNSPDGNESAAREHFARFANNWAQIGMPLRPTPEDIVTVQRHVEELRAGDHVALLGLTPEIVGCLWPDGVRLTAVDHNASMMASLWPPLIGPADATALLGDWCALPLVTGSLDLVVGDGCYALVTQREGFERLSEEIHRVLRENGRFLIRVFVRPPHPETLAAISRDFVDDKIDSVHVLKLRLWAALHEKSGSGTLLDDVWQAWESMSALHSVERSRRGWGDAEIGSIERYRGMTARYVLPTLVEFRTHVAVLFAEQECVWGSYPGAERCPTLVLTRRGAGVRA